jgi:hypothetical protein
MQYLRSNLLEPIIQSPPIESDLKECLKKGAGQVCYYVGSISLKSIDVKSRLPKHSLPFSALKIRMFGHKQIYASFVISGNKNKEKVEVYILNM